MADLQNTAFADSIAAARERLTLELHAKAEQIQKLNLALSELQTQHERTEIEMARQWDSVTNAAEAAVASMVPKVTPEMVLDRVYCAVTALMNCANPEEVTSTLSDQASNWGVRAAIFDVRGKSVWGAFAHGFGAGLADGALRSVVIQLTQDSPFRQLCDTATEVSTNADALKKNRNLIEKLKPAVDAPILLLPIRSAGTVTAIFYADPGEGGEELPVQALRILAEFAGAQIDRLIALSGAVPEAIAAEAAKAVHAEPWSQDLATDQSEVVSNEIRAEDSAVAQAPPSQPVRDQAQGVEHGAESVIPLGSAEADPSTLAAPEFEPATVQSGANFEQESTPHEGQHGTHPVEESAGWKPSRSHDEETQEFPVPEEVAGTQSSPHLKADIEASAAPQPHLPEHESSPAVASGADEPGNASTESAASHIEVVGEISQHTSTGVGPDLSPMGDAEQKTHKDAKRFAKLLVSEIELYNKARVAEGRQNGDLYKRLKSDIDRSRMTFEKRFGKNLSPQIDYFHDELVKILATNDVALLGPEYPGPSV